MKRCFLLIAWLAYVLPGMTQNNGSPIEQSVLTAMSQLSYDSLRTGIHIDRVPQYLPVKAFDGTLPSDSIDVSWNALSLLYSMLAWSQVDTFPLTLMDSTLSEHWDKWDDHDTLLIGGLWMQYDRFKPWAIDSNLLTWDGSFFHAVPGAFSPFEQDVLFALSMTDDVRYGLTQILYFDPDWLFTNQTGGWVNLEMDAGDGLGWRSVSPGDVLTIEYAQEGLRYLDFRMVTSTGDTLICTASMDVRAESNLLENETRGFGDEPDDEISIGAITTWKVWESYTDKCGKKQWRKVDRMLPAGLKAYIFYNKECETPALRKPLFIVNGFDPARSHGWEFVMGEKGLLNAPYQDDDGLYLSDHLHDEHYDLIYVTFSDATGDIRTNAGWLRQLIEQVNSMKAAAGSEEKNIVIGASMGGLVSKWALLTMQNDGVDHETELFMTVDSPLRGAHIPLGMQAMVKDLERTKLAGKLLKNMNKALSYNMETLHSKGAKQMLYYNWMTVDSRETNGPSLGTDHDEFFTEFEALGTLDIPHVAISNGAINGVGNDIIPGEKLLADVNYGNIILALLKSCKESFNFGPAAFSLKIDVWASPGYTGIIGLEGHKSNAHYAKNIWARILNINFPVQYETYTAGNVVNWDSAPGGLRSFNTKNEQGDEEVSLPWKRKSFCFIPTISALDLDTDDPFYNGINLLDVKQTVESGQTRLRSYVGAVEPTKQYWQDQYSQEHVTFDRRTANFVKSLLKTYRMDSNVNPLTDRTFNFGAVDPANVDPASASPLSTRKIIDIDLTILQDGKLWIHRDDRIAFTNEIENPFCSGIGVFDVHVTTTFCEADHVTIDAINGGEIRIGDKLQSIEGQLIFHNQTALHVADQGEVFLEGGYHNNLILDGGIMEIRQGGLVRAEHGSRILVREGSTLTIRSGGILRIAHHSSLLVEAGGMLVLEPGAIIQLWDGPKLQGEGTIHIQKDGELEWQGDIQFLGNGYFQFDAGHIFTLSDDFNLTGYAKDCRFIRLNPKAHLNIDGYNMTLTDGLIESIDGGSIRNLNGNVVLEEITFSGPGNIALKDPISSIITNSTILNASLEIEGFQGNREDNLIKNCVFEYSGFSGKNSKWMTLIDNTFLNGGPSMYCEEVDYVYCSGIYMDGESTPNNNAVILHNTPIFRFHHSNIRDYETGIYVLRTNENERTNLFLYGSTINDCGVGIYDPDLDLDKELPGYENGLVLMDCSRLAENGEGILGGDLLLSIDAQIHSGSHIGGEVYPNYFANYPIINTPSTNNIFEICYNNRQPDEILARRNEWANGVPNPSFDFRIKRISTNNPSNPQCSNNSNVSPDVPVIFQPTHFSDVALYCPEPPRISPHDPCNGCLVDDVDPTDECIVGVTQMVSVHDSYRYGIYNFYHENLEEATAWFQPIAAISDDQRNNLSAKCQHYIDVARVMTNALQEVVQDSVPPIIPIWSNPFDNKEEGLLTHSLEASYLQVYPNPANEQLTIQLSESNDAVVHVVNMMGTLHRTFPAGDLQTIPTGDWPAGLYEIQLRDAAGRIVYTTRISIVH